MTAATAERAEETPAAQDHEDQPVDLPHLQVLVHLLAQSGEECVPGVEIDERP